MSFTTRIGVLATLLGALGCGGSGGGDAARTPASAGQVWEIDHPDDRAGNAGALQAFVSGFHVMVVDGDELYTGTTRLKGMLKPGGGMVVQMAGGRTAELTPAGEGMEVHFSTGETVPMRKRGATR